MTDNEIMKNVRCCADHYCKDCSLQGKPNCKETLLCFAWNTMYNQKAEIEKLTINMNAFGLGMKRESERADNAEAEIEKLHPYKLHYGNLRMEIAREVCDRLKAKASNSVMESNGVVIEATRSYTISKLEIDNLVKEMEKENE